MPRSRKIVARLVSLVVFAIAILMISLGFAMTRTPKPGRLIARQPLLTWRSPLEKTFRLLSLDAAQATFQLENVGGIPVRILDVQTTCGCTTPKIDPMVIPPGTIRDVEVKATPLQIGEKLVSISITTDSPITPKIVLQLRIIGSRAAPYMSEARGDLNYSGNLSTGEIRFIYADTIEITGSQLTPPVVKNYLAFIDVSPPKLEKEGLTTAPGTVHRRYIFEARLRTPLTLENEYGQIQVIDPWDSEHISIIHVHSELLPLIRVSPPRAILTIGKKPMLTELHVKFFVAVNEAVSDLVVEVEDADSPLVISKVKSSEQKNQFVFSVSINVSNISERLSHKSHLA